MRLFLPFCLVSLTLTLTGAITFSYPPPGCHCKCECEDEEVNQDCVTPPPPTTTCKPISTCDVIKDKASDWYKNYLFKVDEKMLEQIYKDCLYFEGQGEKALEGFVKNIISVCRAKGVIIEPPLDECSTTCVPTSKCDSFKDKDSDFYKNCAPLLADRVPERMYEDCKYFESQGEEALDGFCKNIKTVCSVKGVNINFPDECTTTCVPTSKCDSFKDKDSDFYKNCAPLLADRVPERMYEDCKYFESQGEEALDGFCKNIKTVCSVKGVKITFPDECTPPTTCEDKSICENFIDPNSEFYTKCYPLVDPKMAKLMYEDCLYFEKGGAEALAGFLKNIIITCKIKGVHIHFHQIPCTTPTMPVTTTCVHSTKCDNFKDKNSDFYLNCAPLLADRVPERMYEDCKYFESQGEEALDGFCKNIKTVCSVKGVKITFPEGECPTTPQPTFVVEFDKCNCTCVCPGELPTPPLCTTTPKIETTTCFVPPPCAALDEVHFPVDCKKHIDPKMLAKIREDCEYFSNNIEAVEGLFKNLMEVCKAKGYTVTIKIIDDCEEPPTVTPCPCVDVVFMLDASQSMLGNDNFQLEVDFAKNILGRLTSVGDCACCTHVGLMSWGSTTHVKVPLGTNNDLNDLKNKMNGLYFEQGITNSHLTIAEFVNQIKTGGRSQCQPVGVLLTDGKSTDWRATLDAMISMYTEIPAAKMFVVAAADPDVAPNDQPRPDEVRAIATGTGTDNLIEVDDFVELSDNMAQDAADDIMKPYVPEDCGQFAVTDTFVNGIGNLFVGAYVKTADPLCNGKAIYEREEGIGVLAVQSINYDALITPANWMVSTLRYPDCQLDKGQDPPGSYAWATSAVGAAEDSSNWKEVEGGAIKNSGINVHCYH